MLGLSLGLIAPALPAAGSGFRYMLAANRFTLPLDWGNTSSAFASGGGMTGINGGTGTVLFQYFYRRIKFSTGAWRARDGRFLWQNSAMGINGVLDGLFSFTIQKAEIRSASGALVDSIYWGASASKTMAPGERVWSDACAALEPLTTYFLDVYWTADSHVAWPATLPNYLSGEVGAASLTTNFAVAGPPVSGQSFAIGGTFGPSAFVARGWDKTSLCALLLGDSILDQTSLAAALAPARGDFGHIQQALGDASGGVATYMSAARYSSASVSLLQDNLNSAGGKAFLDWFKLTGDLLQPEPVFNLVIDEHGRNNMGANLSQQKSWLTQTVNRLRGFYPGMPYFKTTCPPYTTVADGSGYASEAGQTAGANELETGWRKQWNDWLLSGADGNVSGAIDTASVCHGTSYGKWKIRPFSTTLLDAVAASSTNEIRVADAPAIGESLVFEAGDAANYDAGTSFGYCVSSVSLHASGGYKVTLMRDARNSVADATGSQTGRPAKAHAASTAVQAISTRDFLHPCHRTQVEMSAIVAEAKPALAAAAVAQ